jgi:hypothetical protein
VRGRQGETGDVGRRAGAGRGLLRLGLRQLRDWRPTVARVTSLLRATATSFVVLGLTLWSVPGISTSGLLALARLVVLVAVVSALLRPVLVACAVALGGVGALVLGIGVNTIVLYVAFELDPGVEIGNVANVFLASWLAAALTALINWLADAGSDDAFLGQALRQMTRAGRRGEASDEPGLLIIQIDGLGAGLLGWAVKTGNLPNLGRWLRSGSYRTTSWHTGLPSSTPASQAGMLHGDVRQVPAFRWYEKEAGRLIVTNRPRDAAEVEARISNGRGLLADGGVSISNVFTGDAEVNLLTFSKAALPGRSARGYAAFMTSPYGLARAVVLGVGEILKEIHQARRQARRGVLPRVRRGGWYVLLRAVTNVLLRDLNMALIAEQMSLGAPVIFCDFVDYDEVAHHAGPARPEALQALDGLDRALGTLRKLSETAARRYEIVVVSDHGQSQGAPFRQRYGETLEQVVHRLMRDAGEGRSGNGGHAAAATGKVEDWGPVNLLLTGMTGRRGPAATATRAAMRTRMVTGDVNLGPARRESHAVESGQPEVVVVASGNLAMIYLTGELGEVGDPPTRLTVEQVREAFPGLVDGLSAHPGVGFVVGFSEFLGPVAIGPRGSMVLRTGVVTGEDPLAPYGPYAVRDLLAHQDMAHVGDLVVISRLDPDTDEVAAFEELVGCHGGLGGGQTEAVLVYPAQWALDERPLVGPDAVHRQLVRWLERLGLRKDSNNPAARAVSSDPGAQPGGAGAGSDGVRAGGVAPGGASAGGVGFGAGRDLAPAAEAVAEQRDGQHNGDHRDHALPRLGEDGAAREAESGVHG